MPRESIDPLPFRALLHLIQSRLPRSEPTPELESTEQVSVPPEDVIFLVSCGKRELQQLFCQRPLSFL